MRMPKWLLLLAIVSFNMACNERSGSQESTEQPDKNVSFNESDVIQLDGQTLTEADTLARPSKIVIAGPYLIIKDAYGQPPIHVIRASDGSYVTALGTPGEGPGEFIGTWSFDVVSGDPPRFWIYDMPELRLTYVDLEAYLRGAFELGDRIINLNIGFTPTAPTWLGDSLFVSPGFLTEEGRLAQFSPEGTFMGTIGISPPSREGVPLAVLQHAYQSWMKPNPNRSLLALGTFYADRLEIYRPNGIRKLLVQGPAHFNPTFEVGTMQGEPARQSTDETRYGYIDIATTQRHIYALYSGRLRDQQGNYGDTVRVFDWDGNLNQVYNLNAAVLGIAVAPDETRLYATQRAPTVEISTYRLPPSL